MSASLKWMISALLAVVLASPAAHAQERPAFTQAELDQMLAPIALYPDSLLSQMLMAATYPLEIVQAARWTRSNPHLGGEDAVRAVESMDWDPSVKSLVAFPQVVQRMDEDLQWTQRLGEAFIAQEPQVMETIQGLRRRAAAVGNLDSGEQVRVISDGGDILIEPARPEVVYVPYYNPTVVYGAWWWPAYPPVYWAPWPGYVYSGYAPGFLWGSGIAIRLGFFFGHFDWSHRHVLVVPRYYRRPADVVVDRHVTVIHRGAPAPAVRWRHDARHRRGVPFRHVDLRGEHRHGRSLDRDARVEHRVPGAAPLVPPRFDDRPGGFRGERRARVNVDRGAPPPQPMTPSAPSDGRRSGEAARLPPAAARSAPQTPVQAVPPSAGVTPPMVRSDARPAGSAFRGSDEQTRYTVPTPVPVVPRKMERRGHEPPPAAMREEARSPQPRSSFDAPNPRGEARALGARFHDSERQYRRPPPAPAPVARAIERREAGRPMARPPASLGGAVPSAGNSHRRGEVRHRGERGAAFR